MKYIYQLNLKSRCAVVIAVSERVAGTMVKLNDSGVDWSDAAVLRLASMPEYSTCRVLALERA